MSVTLYNINATQGDKKIHSHPLNSKHTSFIKTVTAAKFKCTVTKTVSKSAISMGWYTAEHARGSEGETKME
jgi:hypothetical protein